MNWLQFELMIMDTLENEGFGEGSDPEKVRDFSDELHQHLETAVCDYCLDYSIDDYVPVY